MRGEPTNSLIVTRLDGELLKFPDRLADLLASRNFNVEVVFLPKFARYIIITASPAVAETVREFLAEKLSKDVHISFSMKNNPLPLLDDGLWVLQPRDSDMKNYLELPLEDGSRRFLILPPLSPHSEWNDYAKVEEGPNTKSVYSPQELSHLLWDRFGGFDSSQVRRFDNDSDSESDIDADAALELAYVDISEQPEVLFEDIHNGVPAIVVDSVKNQKRGKRPFPKTAMPPPM